MEEYVMKTTKGREEVSQRRRNRGRNVDDFSVLGARAAKTDKNGFRSQHEK
jgi:hypothetical protein